jgi:hypothetical protein
MLDKPEKTRQLVTALKAAVPFEVQFRSFQITVADLIYG